MLFVRRCSFENGHYRQQGLRGVWWYADLACYGVKSTQANGQPLTASIVKSRPHSTLETKCSRYRRQSDLFRVKKDDSNVCDG